MAASKLIGTHHRGSSMINSQKASRCPLFWQLSLRPRECQIHLAKVELPGSTPRFMTWCPPDHRSPDLSRCLGKWLPTWRLHYMAPWNLITSSYRSSLPSSASLATRAAAPWMTPYWTSSNDPSRGERRISPQRWLHPLPWGPQKGRNPSWRHDA